MIKKIVASIGIVFFLGLSALPLLFSSCEKDDICIEETPKTPLLFIEFYDVENPTTPKAVNNLEVRAEAFLTDTTHVPLRFNNVTFIKIPLDVTQNSTTYYFTINAGNQNPNLVNTDKLVFTYNRSDIYISRACGFKTFFDFNVLQPIQIEEVGAEWTTPTAPGIWILSQLLTNTQVQADDEAHLNLFF